MSQGDSWGFCVRANCQKHRAHRQCPITPTFLEFEALRFHFEKLLRFSSQGRAARVPDARIRLLIRS